MRYEIPVLWLTSSAKNKATIPAHINLRADQSNVQWLVLEAENDAKAYALVVRRLAFVGASHKPISGRRYVRKWRAAHVHLNDGLAPQLPKFNKGDRIILHVPHAEFYRHGTVDEVLGDWHYGVKLDNYPRIADFTIREFALENKS